MKVIHGRDVSSFYDDDEGIGEVYFGEDVCRKGNIIIKINNTKISIKREELEKVLEDLE